MEQMDFSIELSESEIEKFADYLYQKENAKATINKYMADIKKFLSFLADDKRINKKVLLQYKEWLAQKYAVNSVAALNQFLEFLNVGKLKVKRIKVQKQPFLQDQKELTEKECRKLIATAMDEELKQKAQPFLDAIEIASEKVWAFINAILARGKELYEHKHPARNRGQDMEI